MSAYDLANMIYTMSIGNFNVMSHEASRFAKPMPNGRIKNGETKQEYIKRYNMVIDVLEASNMDIVALEEVSNDFYQMLKSMRDYYIIYEPKPNNLATIVKKSAVLQPPTSLPVNFEHKYSKVQGINVILNNKVSLNIYNVQLIGDPAAFKQRREVLRNITDASIIIGDFNEDRATMEAFVTPNMPEYVIDGMDYSVDTSYSRFLVKSNQVIDIKEQPWENIDHIIYFRNLRLLHKEIYPEGGLNGKQVPYSMISSEPFAFARNYSSPYGWPSDHSLQMYIFMF